MFFLYLKKNLYFPKHCTQLTLLIYYSQFAYHTIWNKNKLAVAQIPSRWSAPVPGHFGPQLSRESHHLQRTLHPTGALRTPRILGSLVSGTQHLFQQNQECVGPAGAGTVARVPSSLCWSTLVSNSAESPTVPRKKNHFQALSLTHDLRIPGSQEPGHTTISGSQRKLHCQEIWYTKNLA